MRKKKSLFNDPICGALFWQTKCMYSVCLFEKTKQNKTRIPLLFFLVSYCLLSWTLLFCSFQIPDQLLSLACFASPLHWSDCLRSPIAAPSGAISSVCVWTPKKLWVLFLSFRVSCSHDPEMAFQWVACFHISKHSISLICKVFSVLCLGLPEQQMKSARAHGRYTSSKESHFLPGTFY